MTDIEQIKREVFKNIDIESYTARLSVRDAIDYLHSRGYLGDTFNKYDNVNVSSEQVDAVKVPDGYVLVPKQPTTEILKAMCDCDDDAPWIDLWEAAIAAAPKGETKCY